MIEEAIEKLKAEGWTIVSDSWGSVDQRRCCAVGAVAYVNGLFTHCNMDLTGVAKLLGWSDAEIWNVVAGFDAEERWRNGVTQLPEAFEYGAALRAKYLGSSNPRD